MTITCTSSRMPGGAVIEQKTRSRPKRLVQEALDAYRNLPPPETGLPDTPEPTFKELVDARTYQYWQDRDEPVPTHDDSPSGIAMKIIASEAGLPKDAPGELLMWAATKAVLAGKVWQTVAYSQRLRGQLLPPGITDDEWHDLIPIMSGRLRVIIKDGVPSVYPYDYGTAGKELFMAVEARRDEWLENHKLLARSKKLRKVIPYMRDAMPILLRRDNQRGSKAYSLFEAPRLSKLPG